MLLGCPAQWCGVMGHFMARRRRTKINQGDGWMILAGLAFALLTSAAQIVRDYWPFLFMALGAAGVTWVISCKRTESDNVGPPNLAAQAPTSAATSLPMNVSQSPPPRPTAFSGSSTQVPDFGRLASVAPIVTNSAAIMPEPEFRISAIVETRREPIPSAREGTPAIGRQARWIPPVEAVAIKGLTIGSGMIYMGETLGGNRWANENCLIDPTLPVARAGAGSTHGMTYWSRYDAISPANRRAYLEWLASDRCDPSAEIGLVFLFFYGLEFRFFKEGVLSDGTKLAAEVERLLGLYGSQHSFRGYAERFLQGVRLTRLGQPAIRPEIVLDSTTYGYELPLDVRIWLGQKLASAQPFDADDALLWLAALPDRSFRTPVTRCPEEFQALWRLRYVAKFPNGLKVSAPKGRIKVIYRAASSTFEVPLKGIHENLPDIGAISAPVKKLRELVEVCTTELDAFSRFVGKRPEESSSLQAALLLPRDVSESGSAWAVSRARVETFFAGQVAASVPLADLFGLAELPLPCAGRVPQGVMAQLCQILDRLDVGFEPDRRYGGPLLDADARVWTFRASDGAPVDPGRAAYLQFRGLIEINCLAAASDGTIAREEIEAVLVSLRTATTLSAAERARLIAYALSLQLDPPKQQAVLKRLAGRPLVEREACSRAALAAVMADGYAAPAEVTFLERLHKALSLPVEGIYTAIHRTAADVSQRLPDASDAGTAAHPDDRPHGTSNVVAIDVSRLERIRRETQAVSSLLSDIFVEDAAEAPVSGHPPPVGAAVAPAAASMNPPNEEVFAGLDPAHAELLAHLLARGSFSRETFDQEARSRKLLPDGAVETINEWAFDQLGEALLEGDDDLTIAAHLRDQLPPIKAAA